MRFNALRNAKLPPMPPNNGRPNSGLREGGVTHAEVNAAISTANKTVIFGQQNRLRNGILIGDEKLSRFHAGHELVRFFYNGLKKLPEYLLDAFLGSEISVTLITGAPAGKAGRDQEGASAAGGDLLFFRDVRCHQAFHIGYTRRTIYLPEGVLREAIHKGYDSWSVSETIIREVFPLLDYQLILNFVRHSLERFKTHVTLGSHTAIKRAVRQLNHHLNVDPNDPDAPGIGQADESEFGAFFRHYCPELLKLNRKILDEDPYVVADRIYDEVQERGWADVKVNQIAQTFDYPTFFDLDRDIVHPAAHRAVDILGLETAPQSPADHIHDMKDAARFRVSRQTHTNRLLDGVVQSGGPGIFALAEAIGEERATGRLEIAQDQGDSYDAVAVFKEKLLALSSTGPEGAAGSICNDLRDLLQLKTKDGARAYVVRYVALPAAEQREGLPAFKRVVDKVVGFLNFPNPDEQAMAAATVLRARRPSELIAFAEHAVGEPEPEKARGLMLAILKKLNKHPDYHTTILAQAQQLEGGASALFGEDVRGGVASVFDLIPRRPYTHSSDPQGLRARLMQYEQLRQRDPDAEGLVPLLGGILIRLDRADNYERLIAAAHSLGPRIRPELESAVETLNPKDEDRRRIVEAARALLNDLPT